MLRNFLICVHSDDQLSAQGLGLSQSIGVPKVDHVIAGKREGPGNTQVRMSLIDRNPPD